MTRPTIKDLAEAAGVSRATVNRLIGDPEKVRPATRQRIVAAASDIGFYGLELLVQHVEPPAPSFRLACLFQQPNQWFCERIVDGLRTARAEMKLSRDVRLKAQHVADLSPELIAEQLFAAARKSDAIIIVAAEHPVVIEAIERVSERGTPVYALVSTLSAPSLAGFVGMDSRKVGRTAAWALHRLSGMPDEIGILLGSPRYRSHEMAESGFRSYFREHDIKVRLLDPLTTFESDGIAREMTERLLADYPGMNGLYLAGGGTPGVLAALRETSPKRKVATVAYDLTSATRSALLDGTLDLVISHPFEDIGRRTLAMAISDVDSGPPQGRAIDYVGFEMYTAENV